MLQHIQQLLILLVDQRFSMSQLNEGWASRTQDERDEMAEKDKEQRIKNLSLKYGRTSVRNVRASAEREEKKTGKRISFLELKKRIEDAKEENRDKKMNEIETESVIMVMNVMKSQITSNHQRLGGDRNEEFRIFAPPNLSRPDFENKTQRCLLIRFALVRTPSLL